MKVGKEEMVGLLAAVERYLRVDHDAEVRELEGRVEHIISALSRAQGIRAGLFRPVTLWPFPSRELAVVAGWAEQFLTVELSTGQLVEDVRLAVSEVATNALMHAEPPVVVAASVSGETLRVDTGCLVALQPSVSYDIQFVGKVKTALFGGEGLFFATLSGPGRVWLQSLPLSRLAGRIYAAAPQTGGARREEGSLLGGLGNLLDGDGR